MTVTRTKRKAGRVTALAGWGGGKRSIAHRVNEELGNTERLFVPFAGGFPTLKVCPEEVYNDANWKPILVMKVLQQDLGSLEYLLKQREFSKQEFEAARARVAEAAEQPIVSSSTNLAADLLTVWWMGPGGIAGTKTKPWFAQRHTSNGGCPRKRWQSFLASLGMLAERYGTVGLTCMDFRKFLSLYYDDLEGDTIYSDSPYLSKGFEYEVDFTPKDHVELAEILNSYRRARVVVSYRAENSTEESWLDTHYPRKRWRRVQIEQAKAMSHASGKSKRNTEVLLVNDGGQR